jgi:hypothetical protein
MVDENRRPTSSSTACLHVAPAIADDHAAVEVEEGRPGQQAWRGLPAATAVGIVVVTDTALV